MRTRILVALVLLTLLLAPAATRAGSLSRTAVPYAQNGGWNLGDLWSEVFGAAGNWASGLSIMAAEASSCIDPDGSCGPGPAPAADESSCIDPNGQCKPDH